MTQGGRPLGSIRLSNIADGIEDWELFNKLGATSASISKAADLIVQVCARTCVRVCVCACVRACVCTGTRCVTTNAVSVCLLSIDLQLVSNETMRTEDPAITREREAPGGASYHGQTNGWS